MKKCIMRFSFIFLSLMATSITASAMGGRTPGPNRAPVARAGFDFTVAPYHQAMFDGRDSFDPDGDYLTYDWDLLAAPEGAQAVLTADKSAVCCFSPDKTGVWMISLTVSDRRLKSEPDVVRVNVKLPEPSELPGPEPTQPDLEISKIIASGVHDNAYVDLFLVKLENLGSDYFGPIDFRIIGMDRLTNGQFSLDRRVTENDVDLHRGEQKLLSLMSREIEWPEVVRKITFAAIADPDNKIDELNENNNNFEKTLHRFNLSPCCNIILSDTITINGRRIRRGRRYTFPIKTYGTMIGINLINCSNESKTSHLQFVYDWTPLKPEGENTVIRESDITVEAGEEKYVPYQGLRVPRKEKYKTNYTTFAIVRHHEKGYDVLYEFPARADYVKVVGK